MEKEMRNVDLNSRIRYLKYDIFAEDGKPKIKLTFTNCSYGTITAMKFVIHGYNSFSEPVLVDGNEEFTIVLQNLYVFPLEYRDDIVSELPNGDITKAEIKLFKVCYNDGSVIEIKEPEIVEYEVEKLQPFGSAKDENISEYEQLSYIRSVNSNAICYPEIHSNGWICICGELNRDENEKCAICGSEKKLIFTTCTKENVIKKCKEERERKKAEEERRIEEREKEREEEKRRIEANKLKEHAKMMRKVKGVGIAAVVCILAIVLWRMNYVKTYGMDKETYAQWETALQEYRSWESAVTSAWFGEGGYNDAMMDVGGDNHTYSEIYSMKSLNASRNAVLDKVSEIDLIVNDFPEKYRPVIKQLAEYQKTAYVMDIDVSTVSFMCDVSDFLSDAYDREQKLEEDIKRLEGYLEDEYLNTDKMDLDTSVSLSYSPKTFSYRFGGRSYESSTLSSSELSSAKSVADSYCQMLINKQSSISTITYTGTNIGLDDYAYFEYKVNYNDGTTRTGKVKVEKDGSLWVATGMSLD